MYTPLAANDVGLHIYYIQTQHNFYTTNIQVADGTVATVQTIEPNCKQNFYFFECTGMAVCIRSIWPLPLPPLRGDSVGRRHGTGMC